MDIKDKIQKIIDDNISKMPLYIDYQKLADEIYQLVMDERLNVINDNGCNCGQPYCRICN